MPDPICPSISSIVDRIGIVITRMALIVTLTVAMLRVFEKLVYMLHHHGYQ